MLSPSPTIVAIATPPGRGGVGMVRVSGAATRDVARALLGRDDDLAARHATLCHVFASDGVRLDEVVATFFPAPHSYTAEDVLEISAHGSPRLLGAIVRAAMDAGARLAEPGEFTLRAFLNGRVDLVQAEAVADLVDAVTPLQARVAFDQLEGTLTRRIAALDEALFDLAARLEASLDFPDEGYHFVGPDETQETLGRVAEGIDALLATAGRGRLIRDGRQIAILGKPNVGKSTLFNWLVGTDRAIVTAIPGTTRDLVTESIDFEGIRLAVVDTAGIRTSDDHVEREGVLRARQAAAVADVAIVVCDISRPLEAEDEEVLAATAGVRRVVVGNKADLGRGAWGVGREGVGRDIVGSEARSQKQEGVRFPALHTPTPAPDMPSPAPDAPRPKPHVPRPTSHAPVIISAKTGEGLEDLRVALRQALEMGDEPLRDTALVTNLRHEQLLRVARGALGRACEGLAACGGGVDEELVLADIAAARVALESITGRRTTEDVLRRIFERFCIGK